MKKTISDLMTSKKFLAFLTGTAATFIATKIGIPAENVGEVLVSIAGMTSAFCVSQGVADHGKEKAKVEAAAPAAA